MASGFRKFFSIITVSLGIRAAAAAAIAVGCFTALPDRSPLLHESRPAVNSRSSRGREVGKVAVRPEQLSNSLSTDVIEASKLTDVNPVAANQFGFSVAIDGDTAIVGSPGDSSNKGSASIFVRNGTSWTLQQKITGSDSVADDNFGWSVAISGETVVVGAVDLNEVDQGAVYVFERNGVSWAQQQKLTATGGSVSDQFGMSVGIDADTVAVGSAGDQSSRGAAYIFTRSGVTWTQQQKLTASDAAADDDLGWSIGVSGDSVAIGAPGDDASRGSAYVFVRNGSSWSQQAKLVASDGAASSRFGFSISVDSDNTLVGAPQTLDGGKLSGAAYVFSRSGTSWQELQKLSAADGESNDKFGGSVFIKGSSAVIGANGDDVVVSADKGSCYLFSVDQTLWTQTQKFSGSDASTGDNFGGSVAIRNGAAVVGSYLDDGSTSMDSGSAFIFSVPVQATPSPTPTPVTANVSGRVLTPDGFGLRSAKVTIADAVLNTTSTTISSTLGYFQFSVVSGRDYVITVSSKRYRFSNASVSINGDLSGIEFIGLE